MIDGNGESDIVSVFVVSTDNSVTLDPLLNITKENNPAWTKIKTVLSDKDFTERSVYSRAFPLASLQICLFHTFSHSTINEEGNKHSKMGIGIEQKNLCLEIAYTKNEDESEKLTPYACQIVMKQINLSSKLSIDHPSNVVLITNSSGQIQVTPISCACGFVQLNLLPSRHNFALRNKLRLDLYFKKALSGRWLMAQYKRKHVFLSESSHCDDIGITIQR